MKTKPFDEWLDENEERLSILFAETGQDRELDFDYELSVEIEYEKTVD